PIYPHLRVFSLTSSADHRALHSFPTRRSSDLHHAHRRVLVLCDCEDAPHRAAAPADEHAVRRGQGFERIRRRTLDDVHVVPAELDRKSTRLNSSHVSISYAVFCLKKKSKRYPD